MPVPKCRKLEKQLLQRHNDELKEDVASMGFHQKDVYVYIHEKLDEYSAQVAEYQAEIAMLKEDAVRLRASTQTQVEEATERLQLENAELQEEVRRHVDELSDLQEFRSAMPEHRAMVQSLEEELAKERADREQDKTDMERKKIAEKQRLKTEMLKRVQEAKESILAETVQNLHDTAKRTLAENEQMTTELSYQSRSVAELLVNFTRLERHRDSLRRQLQLSQSQNEVQAELGSKESAKLKRRVQALELALKALRGGARGAPGLGLAPSAPSAAGSPRPNGGALRPARPASPLQLPGAPLRDAAAAGTPRAAAWRVRAGGGASEGADGRAAPSCSLALQRARQRTRAWERRYVQSSAALHRAVASRDALVGALGEGMVVLAGVLQAPAPAQGSVPAPGLRGLSAARLLDAVEEVGQRRGAGAALAVLVGGMREAIDAAGEAEQGQSRAPPSGTEPHSLLVRSVLGDPLPAAALRSDAKEQEGEEEEQEEDDDDVNDEELEEGAADDGGRPAPAPAGRWSARGKLEQPSLQTLASVSDVGGLVGAASQAGRLPAGSAAAALRAGRSAAAGTGAARALVGASPAAGRGQRAPHGVVRLFVAGTRGAAPAPSLADLASPSVAALAGVSASGVLGPASARGGTNRLAASSQAAGSVDTIPESAAGTGASVSAASMAHASVPRLQPRPPLAPAGSSSSLALSSSQLSRAGDEASSHRRLHRH